MATPVAVPLVSSSNFDCSQVRVPSADAVGSNAEKGRYVRKRALRRTKESFCGLGKFNLETWGWGWVQVSTAKEPPQRSGLESAGWLKLAPLGGGNGEV